VSIIARATVARADVTLILPSPLGVKEVVRLARLSRPEVVAASARASAAKQRPAIVSALEDPQIFPSIDHAPFMGGGADISLTIQQSFPLSHARRHRGEAAEAEARRALAQRDQVALDVELDAAAYPFTGWTTQRRSVTESCDRVAQREWRS